MRRVRDQAPWLHRSFVRERAGCETRHCCTCARKLTLKHSLHSLQLVTQEASSFVAVTNSTEQASNFEWPFRKTSLPKATASPQTDPKQIPNLRGLSCQGFLPQRGSFPFREFANSSSKRLYQNFWRSGFCTLVSLRKKANIQTQTPRKC